MTWIATSIENLQLCNLSIYTRGSDKNSRKIYSAMSCVLARSRGNLARYHLSANCVHFLRKNSTIVPISACFDNISLDTIVKKDSQKCSETLIFYQHGGKI
jgi:hypothetical protein